MNIENIINYLILSGFILFTVGIVLSLFQWFESYNASIELQLAISGLVLLILGMMAAKIFAGVKFFERD
jgi:hypothetical protein